MTLKIFVIYLGFVLFSSRFVTSLLRLNHTQEESESIPKYPHRAFRVISFIGAILLIIGFFL